MVEQKGGGEIREMEWLIRDMTEELDSWGHRGQKIILESDREPSIEALHKAVADMRSGRHYLNGHPEVRARALAKPKTLSEGSESTPGYY